MFNWIPFVAINGEVDAESMREWNKVSIVHSHRNKWGRDNQSCTVKVRQPYCLTWPVKFAIDLDSLHHYWHFFVLCLLNARQRPFDIALHDRHEVLKLLFNNFRKCTVLCFTTRRNRDLRCKLTAETSMYQHRCSTSYAFSSPPLPNRSKGATNFQPSMKANLQWWS